MHYVIHIPTIKSPPGEPTMRLERVCSLAMFIYDLLFSLGLLVFNLNDSRCSCNEESIHVDNSCWLTLLHLVNSHGSQMSVKWISCIISQVEYLPISSIEKSKQILEEFVHMWNETLSKRSLPGQFLHMESNFGDYGLADQYTPQHTAVQYATVMAQLIATVQVQAQSNQMARN